VVGDFEFGINKDPSHFLRQLIFYFYIREIGKGCQVNNSVTFSGKPMVSEEFLSRVVEILGIIIDRRPKGRPRKMEN